MIDPYRMVFVNTIASFLVLLGTIVYRFVYPKKKINLFILLLLISILPLLSLLRQGDYESGDFNIHIYRIMSFYDSLMEGNIMPSWAGELNATYGNPLFIFNYSLPYYVISLFHFIGITFISSMKIYLGLTLYLSGIFMYLWIKNLTGNKLAAFTSAIFYIFSPYHLIDVHFRATLGESTIFLLLPLFFLSITEYFKKKRLIFLVLVSLFTDLLFLAHPLLASVFFGIALLYIFFITFYIRNFKALIATVVALIIGIIASMPVWISFILYSPYTFKIPTLADNIVSSDFFQRLFYSPWRYGLLFQGHKGELAHLIGYTQLFVLIASILMIARRKITKKIQTHYIFWVSICLLTLLLMSPISNVIWKHINNISPMLAVFGRLSLAISLFTSIIAGYFVNSFSKTFRGRTFICILLVLTIGSTILNWGHRRVIPEINDTILRKNVWKSTATEGPSYFANTKWADKRGFWFDKRPNKPLDILEGEGTVRQIERTSTTHVYQISAGTPITIRENTLYFPGWTLKGNGKIIDIYPDGKGIINAKLPQGLQYVELAYKDIFLYKVKKIISVSIFLILIISLMYTLFLKRLTT